MATPTGGVLIGAVEAEQQLITHVITGCGCDNIEILVDQTRVDETGVDESGVKH